MKAILPAILLVASFATHAQSAKPPACDELKGLEKEGCLKQGGTVKANSAASGSSAAPKPSAQPAPAPTVGSSAERTAEPDAKKDYTKPDSK
jgi:hypothetical protein